MTSNAHGKEDSNQGEDESKTRSRVSKACTRCRTRKDRCDGVKPACSACLAAEKECVYDTTSKKRGLPEGYVRGLEKLLAIATQGITGLEDALVELMNNETLRRNWNANTTDDFHSNHWRDSRTQRELEALLSDASTTTTGQKRKRVEDDDEGPSDLAEVLANEIGPRFCVDTVRKNVSDSSSSQMPTTMHGQHLPGNARNLLDHYFTYVHCWFPFLSRPHVLRTFYAMSRSRSMTECASAVVWAILAYTTIILPENASNTQSRQLSSEYRQTAHSVIHTALTSCQTSNQDLFVCAQSLLLLAMLDLGNTHCSSAWVHVSTATGVVSLLPSTGESSIEANSIRGFRQAAFILGTAIALQLGQHPKIDSQPLSPNDYLVEDGHDEWEPWNITNSNDFEVEPSFSISVFNRSTRVFKILAEISTRDPMTMTSTTVQSHLANLHHARRNDSVARLADPSAESPPHHVFFMMFHLMVQLHLVSIPTYHETGSLERARLACNTVGLLEVCATGSHFGLSHVPPLLSSALRIASQQATSVQNTFGDENALPSYHDFAKAILEHQAALKTVWPIFGDDPIHELLNAQIGTTCGTDNAAGNEQSVPATFSRFMNSELAPFPKLGLSSDPVAQQTLSPQVVNSSLDHGSYVSTPLHLRNQSVGSVLSTTYPIMSPINYQQATMPLSGSPSADNRVHMFQNPGTAPTTVANTMLFSNTSPSQQGDSLDAVFNEMAYLDTNDWNFERNSDLRDFGFSDDVAFQAFCNDPERVNIPGGIPHVPLSSNRKSWAFMEQGYDTMQP